MIALDLFAGSGWGVACKRLGIAEHGVEIMPEAIETRRLNGMSTIFHDVWEGLGSKWLLFGFAYDVLIASPPCQTFSVAGAGIGRAALDHVIEAIRSRAYLDTEALRYFGELYDPRTALVLAPLAYIARDLPRVVVLEQVPTVLPVWAEYAKVLESWGYSVAFGIVNAEQYGVPQTRKRAILVARWDAEAKLPTPTHSRYYSAAPHRLDAEVEPWVSMATALGWGMTERPYFTIAAGTASGGTDPAFVGGSGARKTLNAERDAGRWQYRSNYSTTTTDGGARPRTMRNLDEPATTITSKLPHWTDGDQMIRLTNEEAQILQSYPRDFVFGGKRGPAAQQIGNAVPPLLAEAILRAATA